MDTSSSRPSYGSYATLVGLSLVLFGWLLFVLAITGLFFSPIIAVSGALMSTLVLFLFFRVFALSDLPEKCFFGIFLFLALLVGFFMEPSVFSGRDQGSFAEAAFRLAQNHTLLFSTPESKTFFDLYGPGVALNFPGFSYTESGALLTQFPLGYTAWLAGFISLFGLSGFAIANTLLFFGTSFFFFTFLRHFVDRYIAFIGTLLFSLSFLPVWFIKLSLSENLALFLFVFLIHTLAGYREHGKFIAYAGALSGAGLLAFTRIEGFAILGITILFLSFSPKTRTIWKHYPWKSLFIPITAFSLLFVGSFHLLLPFYTSIGKALLKFLRNITASSESLASTSLSNIPSLALLKLFFLYGLLPLFLIALVSAIFFVRKRTFHSLLLPALLSIPAFAYFIFPSITPDHPWMLRRFLPYLYPTWVALGIFGIAFLFSYKDTIPFTSLHSWKRTLIASLVFLGLFSFQAYPWWKALSSFENTSLLLQTERLSHRLEKNDLILVDRGVTGSGYDMISGPLSFLFEKHAVYFFNPYDLEKLDLSGYNRVFLLLPISEIDRYRNVLGNRLGHSEPIGIGTVRTENILLTGNTPWKLPETKDVSVSNILFTVTP